MKKTKFLSLVLLGILCSIGNLWAANGDVLFSQDFSSATAVAYTNGTATNITSSSGNNIVGTTASSQFSNIRISAKSGAGIAINTKTGGNSVDATGFFQAYCNSTGQQWALYHNTGFAVSAPTAIKVEMDILFKQMSSGSDYSVTFAVGDAFSNGTSSPASTNVHSGFSIINNSTPKLTQYTTKTSIYDTGINHNAWISIVWVINNTGNKLKYNNPTGSGTTELNDDSYDIWKKTQAGAITTYTKIVSNQAATTTSKTLQNLYIGDPVGKKNEFRLDNIVITDLTPALHTVTFNAGSNGTCGTPSRTEDSAGAGVTLPSVTANTGYTFNGWYDAASEGTKVGNTGDVYKPDADITLYAQYSPLYTITYALGDGSGTTPTESDKVAGAEFTLHDGTTGITAPDGKVFDGWLCNIDEEVKAGGSSYTMTAAPTTFTAQWRTVADKHHVVYYGGGATGTLPTQDDVEEGQKFIVASAAGLTAPSSGMVFRYWSDGVDNYEPGDEYTMETADVELTAVWAPTYAVYFNTKGGSVVESQQVVEGETVAQPGDPTRPLSTFGGWYTDEECTSAYDFSTTITSATTINASNTLYAKWTFSTVTPGVYDAEQYVLDYGVGTENTTAYVKTLTDANLALSNKDALDTYNDGDGKPAQNYPYLGLKIKTNNATLQGWIPADCYVVLKVGHMTAAGTASWKGANTSIASSDTRNAKVYIFEPANEPSLFTFTTKTASTCVLKSIEVRAANAFPTYSSLVHTPDGYASFFSDYDVQIPAGVKANIGSFNESTSVLTLTDIDGDIIPHQTAVILKGVGESTVLTALPSQSSQPEGNDLVGINKEKPKSGKGYDGGDVYVLGYNHDAACLALYTGSNLGANKAWLPVVAASAPSIRIIEANENATALDNMESTEKVVKIIENGQLFILKDGVRYNAIGQIVQ